MAVSIHPYKGYLNTSFRIHVGGDKPTAFRIFPKSKNGETKFLGSLGIVHPNVPYEIKMQYAGNYIFSCNGYKSEFIVEDGYKYGGNKLKTAFVFDDCPWAFIVMHDRTYFFNRDTEESYVEPISPDEIFEISENHVIFKNKEQDIISVYSLEEQKPILWICNVIYYNKEILCWSEEEEEDNSNIQLLIIYSLESHQVVHRITYDEYTIDDENQILYYKLSEDIFKLNLCSNSTPVCELQNINDFITFIHKHYAVYLSYAHNILQVYDLLNSKMIGNLSCEGKLARVNNKRLVDIWSKFQSYRNFDFDSIELTEATLSGKYSEIDIYPYCWDKQFYTEKITYISSYKERFKTKANKEEKCYIKAIGADIKYELQDIKGEVYINDRFFLFYNSKESIVIPRHYAHHTDYRKNGIIHKHKFFFILQCGNDFYTLSRNGFWERRELFNSDFDFSKFELFGVAIKTGNSQCYSYNEFNLGKYKCMIEQPIKYLSINNFRLYEGGKRIGVNDYPEFFSRSFQYGLFINDGKIYLGESVEGKEYNKRQILQDIFDSNEFMNVLLSENGKQIIYRDRNSTKMLDLVTGDTTDFKNLSFINHINGIRPLIRIAEISQAILINPIDGQPIDFDLLNEYQFISPDNQFYADKALDKYLEYHNLITGERITKDEYHQLLLEYGLYPSNNEDQTALVMQNRMDFINEHFEFLSEKLKRIHSMENISYDTVIRFLSLDVYRQEKFVQLFVEIRGVAVIKRISDDSEVARIALGEPLWFLNYVAFSKDSNYVGIVGRYPNGSNHSGLFLIYDLDNKNIVTKQTDSNAVWTVAFNNNNAVAAYTSDPNTFFAKCPKDYPNAASRDNCIYNYNFLTFSPDGEYFACSQQGYLSYRKSDGETRENWGHQPSSLVSIRCSQDPQNEIITYNDLSEMGLADAFKANSVASVSFSNDNKRLMMVGNDGTVIVRNLHMQK